jgi:predicted GTPase
MQQVTLEMDGRSVCLIDSPGFDDTNKSDYDTLKEISDWLTVT